MHDQAQFYVGWGTLSLINAGLAQSKNPQRTSLVGGIPVPWAFGNPVDRDLGQRTPTSGLSGYFFTQRDRRILERPKPF